jgi:hypothetical protein
MDLIFTGSIQAPLNVDIGNSHQFHILEQAENAGVMLPHVADPNYPNSNGGFGGPLCCCVADG